MVSVLQLHIIILLLYLHYVTVVLMNQIRKSVVNTKIKCICQVKGKSTIMSSGQEKLYLAGQKFE